MNRQSTILRSLAALVLVLVAPAAAAQDAAAPMELPVTRVVLFTTGVGYFEHGGTVVGDQDVVLRVATGHMDDLLQSLVLEDLDGGTVRPVRYGARDPLARVLGSYALDLSGDPTLAELLAQARGEALRIETAEETVAGTLVNVERTTTGDGDVRTLLTLAGAEGLRRVALEDVRDLRFENAALRAELDAALAAIARARDDDAHTVTVRFEGEGERRVRVGYIREMPVWKASYRLLLGDDGRADLQGWAIFDNPTSLDLEDVEVRFVAGRPVSFVSALFEPVYAPRARVGAAVAQAFVPEADSGAFFGAELRAAPAPSAMAMEAAADAIIGGGGVAAMADGSATGATFSYRVRDPVSVGRFESVLVPILVADVEAPRAAFYDGTVGPSPLQAVRLVNDTGLHLAAGPVALFDAGGFVGNALLGDVPAGEERWLSHAVDLDVRVTVETSGEPEQLVSVLLRGGIVETSHRLRLRTTVRIGAVDDPRFLVVELPRRPGYEVVSPTPAPAETADALRFGVALAGAEGDATVPTHATCAAETPCTLEVVFERVERRTVALGFSDPQQVRLYLQNADLSAEDRATFERYLDLQGQLVALGRAAAEAQGRLDAVFRDQERVRQNMAALDRTTPLYRRYLADLEAQEDEVDALEERLADVAAERREVQEALDALIAGLGR
jgi:hypothetical protein